MAVVGPRQHVTVLGPSAHLLMYTAVTASVHAVPSLDVYASLHTVSDGNVQ